MIPKKDSLVKDINNLGIECGDTVLILANPLT